MRAGGTSETRMMILLMLVVAGLAAFMSSTGAVAIFIPVSLNLATKSGIYTLRQYEECLCFYKSAFRCSCLSWY